MTTAALAEPGDFNLGPRLVYYDLITAKNRFQMIFSTGEHFIRRVYETQLTRIAQIMNEYNHALEDW